jgi:hypothetical protein
LRLRAGRNVVIGRLDVHHHVTHTTANEVRFMAVTAKLFDDFDRGIGFHGGYDTVSQGGT